MKDVQCYEFSGGIALKNHAISFHFIFFSSYLISHYLCNTFQSAYCPGHSTETAPLKVVNDLFLSLSKGNMSMLSSNDFFQHLV